MYKKTKPSAGSLRISNGYEGITIEQKIRAIMNSNEPITDSSPMIYTERKDGVMPDYDIRADRMEYAVDAMDQAAKQNKAKREQGIGERSFDTMTPEQQTEFGKKYPNSKMAQKAPGGEGKA